VFSGKGAGIPEDDEEQLILKKQLATRERKDHREKTNDWAIKSHHQNGEVALSIRSLISLRSFAAK